MKCPNCGTENEITRQYCVKCGSPLEASIEEVSEASQKDLKESKKRKLEKALQTILTITCIILIPFAFFYFFLPEPSSNRVFITPRPAHISLPGSSQSSEIDFASEGLKLPIPLKILKSGSYITSRKSERDKQFLQKVFHPGSINIERDLVLNWFTDRAHKDGSWGNAGSRMEETSAVLLAFLSEGVSTAHPKYGTAMKKAFDSLMTKDRDDLKADRTAYFSLSLLALIENIQLDPIYFSNININAMLKKLNQTQDKKTGAFHYNIGRKTKLNRLTSLLAIRTLWEAENAGLIDVTARDKNATMSFLKNNLEQLNANKPHSNRVFFRVKSLIIYNILLVTHGNLPEYAHDEISSLTDSLLPQSMESPLSIPAAHFTLLTLYRSDDIRFVSFAKKLFRKYDNTYVQNHWPQLDEKDALFRAHTNIISTALIFRSYAFPYLYPKF